MSFDIPTNAFEIVRLIITAYGIKIVLSSLSKFRDDLENVDLSMYTSVAERAIQVRRTIRMRGSIRRQLGYLIILILLGINAVIASITYNGGGTETPLQVSTNIAQIIYALVVIRLSDLDAADRLAIISIHNTLNVEEEQ